MTPQKTTVPDGEVAPKGAKADKSAPFSMIVTRASGGDTASTAARSLSLTTSVRNAPAMARISKRASSLASR
jgi:hypothetical protein